MHSSLPSLAIPEPAHLPSASPRNITFESLPTLLVTDSSSISSPSTSPIARIPPPTLQIKDHWGVAEVLDLYEQAVQAQRDSEHSLSPDSRPSVVAGGPQISTAPFMDNEKMCEAGKAAIKSSKRSMGGKGRNGRRVKQADVLKVEAKLKVGMESLGW